MRISLLQPKIIRGDIAYNADIIQKLIDKSKGDLLVLPEYCFTGSLILDREADLEGWVNSSFHAKKRLLIPENKLLLVNSIVKVKNEYYNSCEFLPTPLQQFKLYPDETEMEKGIIAGKAHEVFKLFNKSFKVIICKDLKYWKSISTDDLDFALFIYHFTGDDYDLRIHELKELVKERRLPVLASSLVSDKNIGHSTYIDEKLLVCLSDDEGILEIEL